MDDSDSTTDRQAEIAAALAGIDAAKERNERERLVGDPREKPTTKDSQEKAFLLAMQSQKLRRQVRPAGARKPKPFLPTFRTDRDILSADVPELVWFVPGILSQGVTIIASAPKIGKSLLCLGMGISLVTPGRALGKIQIADACGVLYIAMEDNDTRMKKRISLATQDDAGAYGTRQFEMNIEYKWPRADEGGLDAICAWLDTRPHTKLVIIDVLEKYRAPSKNTAGQYEQDYLAVAPLVGVASRYGVAIVVVHHTRKAAADDPLDEISGTHGLTGAADNIIVLKRQRGKAEAVLHLIGRDVEERELALSIDKRLWQWNLLGDAAEYQGNELQVSIRATLKASAVPMTPTDVATALGKSDKKGKATIRQALTRMAKAGNIRSDSGRYFVTLVTHGENQAENPANNELSVSDIDF